MIWIALGIGVGIFCVTFLIWKFIAKRKSLDEFTWKESPQSLIGLFLLVFPLEFRRFLALLIVLFIGAIAAIGAFQIFTQRQRDIELNAKERVKEEKLKYWNKENDASLKVGLLRLWKKYGEVPKEVWSEYQNESDIDVLIEMAAHPWVPEEILIYSLRHGNSRLRIAAMLNTSNKDIVINRLSNDSEDFLRRAVAESPFISKELLKKMRKDDKYSVRIAVAKNKNTEPTDLDDMKDDDEWRVREAIAKNPKVLKGTLEYLSSDDVWQVRKAVAMAPKTPDEYIKNLIQDGSEFVSYAAKNRSITLKKSFSITLETEKKKNIYTSEALRKFAYSENDLDREKAASALNIPKELLEKLAKDFNRNVLVEVAQNPSTPLKSLKLLATHGNPDIREEAILHLISIPKKEWEMQSK